MIDDANFGCLGKRDLEIARFIKDMQDTHGWPGKLIITCGQHKNKYSYRTADMLKDICMMTQSSQSLNREVLKNIKRDNITGQDWKKSKQFCVEKGIDLYAELMVPLPDETMGTYLDGMRFLFDLRSDFINTNPLMLLNGAAMNSPEIRNEIKYSLSNAPETLKFFFPRLHRQELCKGF